jgi:hypothetical protein
MRVEGELCEQLFSFFFERNQKRFLKKFVLRWLGFFSFLIPVLVLPHYIISKYPDCIQISRSKVNVWSVRQEALPVESQVTTDEKLQEVTKVTVLSMAATYYATHSAWTNYSNQGWHPLYLSVCVCCAVCLNQCVSFDHKYQF